MFICIDGIMGSGKTYYAVNYLNDKKSDYYKIFTNINEFKFQDNINLLNFYEFLNIIDGAKNIYDRSDTNDDDIIDYLISYDLITRSDSGKIQPALLVIDEAHNDFDKKNDLLTWLITYHRHLFIDAILITQTYNLIHYSYHKLFEYYLHALPSSRQIVTLFFKYQKYIAVPFNKDTLVGDSRLSKNKKVFELYKSGDKVRTKSTTRKYLIYLLIFIVLGIGGLYYFIHTFFKSTDNTEKVNTAPITPSKVLQKEVTNLTGFSYLKLNCIVSTCRNKDYSIEFNIGDLPKLLADTKSQYLRSNTVNKDFALVYILASSDFLKLFSGVKNEKTSNPMGFNLISK